MTEKDLNDLKKYFKDIYPNIYEHYKFLFDIRTKSRSFEFLLAFESLITLIFITLFQNLILEGELIFLIPLLAFFVSILFSLANLIPKFIWFPWFEKKNLKEIFESRKVKDFYEEGLRSIYGVLAHLGEFDKRRNKIFFWNFLALYIAIMLSFASVLVYYSLSILILLFIPITILLWALIQKGWGKELVPKSPAPEVEKFFDDWKEKVESNKNKNFKYKLF